MEPIVCHFHGKTEHFSIVAVATPTTIKGKGLLRFLWQQCLCDRATM